VEHAMTIKNVNTVLACALLALGVVTSAQARDTKLLLPVSAALSANDAQGRLGNTVKFYFGNQPTPPVLERLGTDKTSQKTNSVGKSAEKACNWAFLSAMLRLEQRAHELGANAVINIVSNYITRKRRATPSSNAMTERSCRAWR